MSEGTCLTDALRPSSETHARTNKKMFWTFLGANTKLSEDGGACCSVLKQFVRVRIRVFRIYLYKCLFNPYDSAHSWKYNRICREKIVIQGNQISLGIPLECSEIARHRTQAAHNVFGKHNLVANYVATLVTLVHLAGCKSFIWKTTWSSMHWARKIGE